MSIANPSPQTGLFAAMSGQCGATARRLGATARGTCPVDMTRAHVGVAHAQSCGKCVPCRIGLASISDMLEEIIDGRAHEGALEDLEELAEHIRVSSDCAIGYQAGEQVLISIRAFREDFVQLPAQLVSRGALRGVVPCPCGRSGLYRPYGRRSLRRRGRAYQKRQPVSFRLRVRLRASVRAHVSSGHGG